MTTDQVLLLGVVGVATIVGLQQLAVYFEQHRAFPTDRKPVVRGDRIPAHVIGVYGVLHLADEDINMGIPVAVLFDCELIRFDFRMEVTHRIDETADFTVHMGTVPHRSSAGRINVQPGDRLTVVQDITMDQLTPGGRSPYAV